MQKEIDFIRAKAKLISEHFEDGNIYDHLIKILKTCLNNPDSRNSPENFALFSYKIKEFVRPWIDDLKKSESSNIQFDVATLQTTLFKNKPLEQKDEEDRPIPDLIFLTYLFNQAGIGITTIEMTKLQLSLQEIVDNHPVRKLRFWGKVHGIQKDYYIIEADPNEDAVWTDDPCEKQLESDLIFAQVDDHEKEMAKLGLDAGGDPLDQLPQSTWMEPLKAPIEEFGKGLNKKIYFICNTIGDSWTRLPLVSPEQIVIARKIRHFCTGNMNVDVKSNPPFPGKEKNFLRAQIARISGTCIISPLNFYQFDEEADEALEEDAPRDSFIENPEFEPFGILELADQGLGNWVHHSSYILPQGRTSWWNPAKAMAATKGLEEDHDEEEEPEEEEEPLEPETGPPLLTPLSEDAEMKNNCPAWSTKISSNRMANFALCVVSSNLWPGAHTIGFGKTFENVYVGWGQKYISGGENFEPAWMPTVLEEFISGPEITEVEDPTPEEEAAWRAAKADAENAEMEEDAAEEDEEEAGEED